SPPPIAANGQPLTIGALTSGASKFRGALDDIRIYSAALGAADIQALAETPPPPQGSPALAAPADLSTGVPSSPTLSWQPVAGAASYEVQVSASADFSAPVFDQSVTTGTSAEVPGLGLGTSYHWRVRAANAAGNGEWSGSWQFTTASAADALVAHWKMDEGTGTLLEDASGKGNHAQAIGGPVRVPGVHGTALALNGSTQYANAPDSPSLDITGAITIAAWIRPEKTGTQYLVRKAEMDGTDGYELSLWSGGRVLFRFNQASSGNTYMLLTSGATYSGAGDMWVHGAATYDGSAITMYVNGVEDSRKTFSSPPPIAANGQPLTIGALSSGASKFRRAVDDIRIYSAALGAADIQALAEVPPVPQSAPVPVSPSSGSVGVSLPAVLGWQAVEGATGYRVQVTAVGGSGAVVFDGEVPGTSAEVGGLSMGAGYEWRVRALN